MSSIEDKSCTRFGAFNILSDRTEDTAINTPFVRELAHTKYPGINAQIQIKRATFDDYKQ